MTMMNIDYKYFAGAKDPIEIINKYRMRGFGTYLNGKEKIRMLEYSSLIEKWNKLYGKINMKSNNSTKKVLGVKSITDNFFKPSNVLLNKLTNYTGIRYNLDVITYNNINSSYKKLYKGDFDIRQSFGIQQLIHNTSCINSNGYVVPFRKWLINGSYEYPIKADNN